MRARLLATGQKMIIAVVAVAANPAAAADAAAADAAAAHAAAAHMATAAHAAVRIHKTDPKLELVLKNKKRI
jgi:hypothetical protein